MTLTLSPRCWFSLSRSSEDRWPSCPVGRKRRECHGKHVSTRLPVIPHRSGKAPRGRPGVHKGDHCLDSRYIREAIRTQAVEVRVWLHGFLALCPWTRYHIYKTEIIIAPALQGTLCMPHLWNNSVIITIATDSLSLKAIRVNAINTSPCSQGRKALLLPGGGVGVASLGNVALAVKPGQSSGLGSEGICWCQSSLCGGAAWRGRFSGSKSWYRKMDLCFQGRGHERDRGRGGGTKLEEGWPSPCRGGGKCCSADLTGSCWRSELALCPIPPTSPPPPEMWVCKGFAEGGATCVSQNQTGNRGRDNGLASAFYIILFCSPPNWWEQEGRDLRPPICPSLYPRASQIRTTGLQVRSQETWTGDPVTWPVSLWPWTHPSPL